MLTHRSSFPHHVPTIHWSFFSALNRKRAKRVTQCQDGELLKIADFLPGHSFCSASQKDRVLWALKKVTCALHTSFLQDTPKCCTALSSYNQLKGSGKQPAKLLLLSQLCALFEMQIAKVQRVNRKICSVHRRTETRGGLNAECLMAEWASAKNSHLISNTNKSLDQAPSRPHPNRAISINFKFAIRRFSAESQKKTNPQKIFPTQTMGNFWKMFLLPTKAPFLMPSDLLPWEHSISFLIIITVIILDSFPLKSVGADKQPVRLHNSLEQLAVANSLKLFNNSILQLFHKTSPLDNLHSDFSNARYNWKNPNLTWLAHPILCKSRSSGRPY